MKLEENDFESLFQTALAQFDDRPTVKLALIGVYRSLTKFLAALIRVDARQKRGRE
jgi:hypothetical protein